MHYFAFAKEVGEQAPGFKQFQTQDEPRLLAEQEAYLAEQGLAQERYTFGYKGSPGIREILPQNIRGLFDGSRSGVNYFDTFIEDEDREMLTPDNPAFKKVGGQIHRAEQPIDPDAEVKQAIGVLNRYVNVLMARVEAKGKMDVSKSAEIPVLPELSPIAQAEIAKVFELLNIAPQSKAKQETVKAPTVGLK